MVGIAGQIDGAVEGLKSGGSLVANEPGNSCREFLHTKLTYLLLLCEDAQGLYFKRRGVN